MDIKGSGHSKAVEYKAKFKKYKNVYKASVRVSDIDTHSEDSGKIDADNKPISQIDIDQNESNFKISFKLLFTPFCFILIFDLCVFLSTFDFSRSGNLAATLQNHQNHTSSFSQSLSNISSSKNQPKKHSKSTTFSLFSAKIHSQVNFLFFKIHFL